MQQYKIGFIIIILFIFYLFALDILFNIIKINIYIKYNIKYDILNNLIHDCIVPQ